METDNEEIGDEEQEEQHQKARAMASLDLPSRREVEDHNLTPVPFRSWCNQCQKRKRTEEWTQEDGEGANHRAVTTYSIDYMYLTEEGEHRASWEDWRSTRTPSEMQRQWRPLDCDENCSRRRRVGIRGSRVVLKPGQDVAIADVQRQEVAARSGETMPMNSPVGESQSNGRVEIAVQRVQGLIRT